MTNGRQTEAGNDDIERELARLRAEALAPPKRRWWTVILTISALLVGGWFVKHQIDRKDRVRDRVAAQQELDARAAALDRFLEELGNRPDSEPWRPRPAPAPEPAPQISDEPAPSSPPARPRPPVPPQPDDPPADDGRIVLDCIDQPLLCDS